MQYKVVEHLTPKRLTEDVEELLNSGWKLYGNLILASHYDPAGESGASRLKTLYLQVLTNEQDRPQNPLVIEEEDLVEAFA